MPGHTQSMLRQLQSRQRIGSLQARANLRKQLRVEAKSIETAHEDINEIIEEADTREANRRKRMKRYGDVGRVVGAVAATVTGNPILGATLYAGGGRIGTEIGEKYVIGGGEGIKKRAGARMITEKEQQEILDSVPLVLNKSKKAILSKQMSDVNSQFKRRDNALQAAQWGNAFEDFITYVMFAGATNKKLRKSYTEWAQGDGTLAEIFKSGTKEGGYIDPTKQVFKGFEGLYDNLGKRLGKNLNNVPKGSGASVGRTISRFEHMVKMNAPQGVTEGSGAKGFTQYSVPKSIFDVSKPVGSKSAGGIISRFEQTMARKLKHLRDMGKMKGY